MIVVSTTALFCQGDDFIREGVLRLLDLPRDASVCWINRFCIQPNLPAPEQLLAQARAFVMAGSPAWIDNEERWYEAALKNNTPNWLVGVRMSQTNRDVLKQCARLVKVATTGDFCATLSLNAAGIAHKTFLDPAFHAPYFTPREKDIDIVFCYRRGVFAGEPDAARMAAIYERLFLRFRDRIGAVVVHEPQEVAIARRIFNRPVFFNSDPAAYADVYGRARVFIGGRIHGAVPVLAMGGEAHLLYGNKWGKQAGVTENTHRLPVRVYKPEDWERIKPGINGHPDAALAEIAEDFAEHRAYLKARLASAERETGQDG